MIAFPVSLPSAWSAGGPDAFSLAIRLNPQVAESPVFADLLRENLTLLVESLDAMAAWLAPGARVVLRRFEVRDDLVQAEVVMRPGAPDLFACFLRALANLGGDEDGTAFFSAIDFGPPRADHMMLWPEPAFPVSGTPRFLTPEGHQVPAAQVAAFAGESILVALPAGIDLPRDRLDEGLMRLSGLVESACFLPPEARQDLPPALSEPLLIEDADSGQAFAGLARAFGDAAQAAALAAVAGRAIGQALPDPVFILGGHG